jgi:small subunit ribosomal protein S1
VVTLVNHGVFLEIEEGVEGFLGAAEVSWTKKVMPARDSFEKGQELTVQILGINEQDRKLALGLKQLLPNPWHTLNERFPVGSVHRRPVKNVVSFGLFVELEEDIDGLIHLSDLSWDDNVKDPASFYKPGDEVEFKILEIKKDEMRISCGVKQLSRSPWEAIREKYPPRARLSGTVSGVVPFGLFVKLGDEVEGLVHITEVSRKKIESLDEVYKPGDAVNVVVLGVDTDRKRLSLSIKQYDMLVEKEELSKVLNNTSSSKVTIGDFMKMKQGE